MSAIPAHFLQSLLIKASRVLKPYKKKDVSSYPNFDRVIRDMEAAGFPFLGSGGARIVFALDADWVLKVDMQASGASNGGEAYLWSTLPEHIREHLAPVVWTSANERLLVMPRATPVEDDLRDWSRALAELQHLLSETLEDYGCYDAMHDFNYGIMSGRLVLIDYNT